MKRMYLFMAAMVAILCVTGCSDENTSSYKPEDYQLEADAIDLTRGMNVVIFDSKGELAEGIELGIKGDVQVYNLNEDVSYSCVHRDGKTYLMPTLEKNAEGIVFDKLMLNAPGNKKLNKELTIVVREEAEDTEFAPIGTTSEEITNRFMSVVGMSFDITSARGVNKSKVLSAKLLNDVNKELEGDLIYLSSNRQPATFIFKQGSSYSSISKSYMESIGLGGFIPAKGFFLGISANEDVSESRRTESQYEWALASERYTRAEGAIIEDALADFAREKKMPSKWTPIINRTINNVLNNPGSESYKNYPETEEGTYALLKQYGGWFFTGCQLGGEYSYRFSKKMDVSEYSMSVGVGLDMSLVNPIKECKTLGSFLAQATSSELAKFQFQFKGQEKEIFQSMECERVIYSDGGDLISTSGDEKVWNITDDPGKWIPLAYRTKADEETGSDDNHRVHFLYELCADQNSTRAKLLKKALTKDSEGLIPYLKYLKKYEKAKDATMILADVILINMNGGDGVPASDVEPRMMRTPSDGKWRMYYPMVANANIIELCHPGFQPNLNSYQVHGQSTIYDNSRHYIFYALDWNAPNVGMTNIRLGKSAKQGETQRGPHTDQSVKGDTKNGSFYIIAEWAGASTALKDKITGFGIKWTDWDNDNGDLKGKVFASTGGTEWDKLSEFKAGEPAEAYFKKYWAPEVDYHRCETDPDTQDGFCDIKGKPRPHTIHICWTKKPIERDMTGYDINSKDKAVDNLAKNPPICLPYPGKWKK